MRLWEQRPSSEACEPVASHVPAGWHALPSLLPSLGSAAHPMRCLRDNSKGWKPLGPAPGPLRQPGAERLPRGRHRKPAAPRQLLADSRCTASWVPASERTGAPSSQSHLGDACPWLPGAAPETQSGAVLLALARHLRQAWGCVDGTLAVARLLVHPGSPGLWHLHVALTSAGERSVPLPAHCHHATRSRLRSCPCTHAAAPRSPVSVRVPRGSPQ